jgi:hypothetical protein
VALYEGRGKKECRRINDEELHDLYLLNIIRVIKKNEMGRTCGSFGRKERNIQGFGGET